MMNKDNRNDKIRKIAKKGLTLSLCAVLAGGLAAGSFEGVSKITGWDTATTVEAASNKNDTTLTYAKSEKKADKDDAKEDDSKSDSKKSDTAKQYVQQWLPIVAAAQLSKDNELEKDFLMKWIDVIDYQQNQIVEIGPERSAQKAEITEITEITEIR